MYWSRCVVKLRWTWLVAAILLVVTVPISAPAQIRLQRPQRPQAISRGRKQAGRTAPLEERARCSQGGKVLASRRQRRQRDCHAAAVNVHGRAVDGENVWTTVKGVAAWCPMSEVVRVEEGINYFTDVIRKGTKEAYPSRRAAMIYTELKHDLNTRWPI